MFNPDIFSSGPAGPQAQQLALRPPIQQTRPAIASPVSPSMAQQPAIAPPAPMPEPAPPMVAAGITEQSPAIQMPFGGYSPTLSIREPSFLSGEDVQAALKQDFMNRLRESAKTRASARGEEMGAKIFGSTIAPALAIFGGAGGSDAGVALIKEANAHVQQGRNDRLNDELNATRGLKAIADIVNTAKVKPLSEAFKAQQKFDLAVTREKGVNEREDKRIAARKGLQSIKQDFQAKEAELKRAHQVSLLEKNQVFKSGEYEKLREQKERFHQDHQRMQLLREKVRVGIATVSDQRQLQKMQQDMLKSVAQLQFKKAAFNSKMEAMLSQRNKDGFKFSDGSGNPLDPRQFQIDLNTDLFTGPKGETLDGIRSELESAMPSSPHTHNTSTPAPKIVKDSSSFYAKAVNGGREPSSLKQNVIRSLMRYGVSFKDAHAVVGKW